MKRLVFLTKSTSTRKFLRILLAARLATEESLRSYFKKGCKSVRQAYTNLSGGDPTNSLVPRKPLTGLRLPSEHVAVPSCRAKLTFSGGH